jgi:hypothetical protein
MEGGGDAAIHSYEKEASRHLVTDRLSSRELPTTTCHVRYKLLVFREESTPSELGKLGYLLPVLLTECLNLALTGNELQCVKLLFVRCAYFILITEFTA